MIRLSGCKVNIGLSIVGKRDDGYHNIESIFFPVPYHDIIEIVEGVLHDEFKVTGIPVEGSPQSNLVIKAVNLMRQNFGIPKLKIHLHKNIPLGAGLGGGSANATNTILLINNLFGLELSNEKLMALTSEIGSDCAFFVNNTPAFVHGRGTEMEKIDVSLSGKFLVIVKPQVHVATADAYSGIVAFSNPGKYKSDVIGDIEKWQEVFANDFESSIFNKYPLVGEIKKKMMSSGALYSSMSGSGASVFGIFGERPKLEFPVEYFCKVIEL